MLTLLLFFIFVHVTLLVPGYVLTTNLGLLKKHSGAELSFGYLVSIAFFGVLAVLSYTLKLNPHVTQGIFWLALAAGLGLFIYQGLYKQLLKERFVLLCFLAISSFSLVFINLSFAGSYKIIPDPQPMENRNYNVLDVKVLNVAQTNANDNYIPYRQAQFFVNHSDPAKDSFIDEWGVHFFQRTPLLGAVTAQYFNAFNFHVPIDYIWSATAADPDATFSKFQVIAQVMNTLFIVPAFYVLRYFFARKAAKVGLLFMIPSQFFLYNAFFSWPKSLVAFFILLSWLLILQRTFVYLLLAGVAGGMAYLSHDLAVLYLGASVLLLLYQKRVRDIVVYCGTVVLFMIPWLLTSVVFYKKPSSFALYPLSLHDIPQTDKKREIISEFFHTSPLRIIAIKLESLFYLLSPYQLIYSEGGQAISRRLWALGIISIPGSVGVGLVLASVLGAIKKIRDVPFWILALVPVILSVIVIGWPKGLGALHFAEAVTVLFMGLGAWYLTQLKRTWWTIGVYGLAVAQLVFFTLYSYNSLTVWLHRPSDLLQLGYMAGLVLVGGIALHVTMQQKEPPVKKPVSRPKKSAARKRRR